uniref:Uncharacterized protein n=1 Tax=Rhizophora mucronata TaxID=61149 RepID=A0A2P2QA06_RHIMU
MLKYFRFFNAFFPNVGGHLTAK